MCWAGAGSPGAIAAHSASPSTPNKFMHVPFKESGAANPTSKSTTNHSLIAYWAISDIYVSQNLVHKTCGHFFFLPCKTHAHTYKMIVMIHTIWNAITELLLPSWQKEIRDITHEVVNSMKEAKKYETAV